ncbi:NUDIX hydrolase [Pelagicoccus sp. SDUM812002]|uniref:NUDIX hydrolase n=1 Tax=Pelagicoccus sp. SDUM812002 TaxID=3041266 RepID=UPI00280FC57F|nr:NUDIX hydrolase [Pelagicoccus sp. SDUM812002]MDQ8186562.1 NUDIX hydrolase [Pelagicoccus sp. SDUM812002]
MSSSDRQGSPGEELVHAWDMLGEKVLVHCPIFDLVSRRLRHPLRKSEGDFYVLKTSDWVNVIPVTPDYQMVLVRQYRFGIEETSWEIPGGIMDAGEDPLVAAERELREETGYVASNCRVIGKVAANPAILDNYCHFVWAESVTLQSDLDWDEHEEMEVRLFAVDEVYAMAHRGEVKHSLVVAALFQFYPEWLKIRARRR